MIFPGITMAANRLPLLGAGQTAQNSDPPRGATDRSVKRLAAVKRPPRMVRVYLLGLPTPTMLPIHRKTLMSVPALVVAPRPRVRFPNHRPTPRVSRWYRPRLVRVHGTLSCTAGDFRRVGPTVHCRPLPGHVSHHRPSRNARRLDRWLHRRRSQSHASRTADAHRGLAAPRPGLHSTRRHAAMSDPDQEPAGVRVLELLAREENATAAAVSAGLDLASVKAIVHVHDAGVHAPNASDGGAVVCVTLPIANGIRLAGSTTRMPSPRSGGSELSNLLAPRSLSPRSRMHPRRSVLQGSRDSRGGLGALRDVGISKTRRRHRLKGRSPKPIQTSRTAPLSKL